MAQIGCLGDMVFSVSSQTIKTIDKLKWSGSAKYQEHPRHLRKSLTEFVGEDPDNISFEIFLSAYLGINPMAEIEKLKKYLKNGTAVYLVIGDKTYGEYKWTIEKQTVRPQTFDKNGNLLEATVSVDLLEYLK